jgi:hypothetical protein
MRTTGRLHRLIACILLATTTLTACTSWHVETASPEQVVNIQHPKAVRVQRMDGSRVELKSPRISSDSLLGTAVDKSFFGSPAGKPAGMPLSDVYQLAVKRGSTGKTIALVVGVAAVAFLALAAAYVITCADSYCGQ